MSKFGADSSSTGAEAVTHSLRDSGLSLAHRRWTCPSIR